MDKEYQFSNTDDFDKWMAEVLEHWGYTVETNVGTSKTNAATPTTAPELPVVSCVAYNRSGEIILEKEMAEVEFIKSFVKPFFNHFERVNKNGHAFRVW